MEGFVNYWVNKLDWWRRRADDKSVVLWLCEKRTGINSNSSRAGTNETSTMSLCDCVNNI